MSARPGRRRDGHQHLDPRASRRPAHLRRARYRAGDPRCVASDEGPHHRHRRPRLRQIHVARCRHPEPAGARCRAHPRLRGAHRVRLRFGRRTRRADVLVRDPAPLRQFCRGLAGEPETPPDGGGGGEKRAIARRWRRRSARPITALPSTRPPTPSASPPPSAACWRSFLQAERAERGAALVDQLTLVVTQVLVPSPAGRPHSAARVAGVSVRHLKESLLEAPQETWPATIAATVEATGNGLPQAARSAFAAGRLVHTRDLARLEAAGSS